MTLRRVRIPVPGAAGVAAARDRVLSQVAAWGVPLAAEQHDAIKLVASELVTNAVVHGQGPISVGLYLSDCRVLLVVHDSSRTLPVRRPYSDDERESGRGLFLVEHFASRSGWSATALGKRVWAEFEVPAIPPARVSLAARRAQIVRAKPRLCIRPHGPVLAVAS
ncbi:ATP-binding protein [Streptomyces hundungensis]|uniref:ATP-binding protein n=1 Tax=Streptomyces hundungensis TaxID=1077946 RepID=UPI0033DB467F